MYFNYFLNLYKKYQSDILYETEGVYFKLRWVVIVIYVSSHATYASIGLSSSTTFNPNILVLKIHIESAKFKTFGTI